MPRFKPDVCFLLLQLFCLFFHLQVSKRAIEKKIKYQMSKEKECKRRVPEDEVKVFFLFSCPALTSSSNTLRRWRLMVGSLFPFLVCPSRARQGSLERKDVPRFKPDVCFLLLQLFCLFFHLQVSNHSITGFFRRHFLEKRLISVARARKEREGRKVKNRGNLPDKRWKSRKKLVRPKVSSIPHGLLRRRQ